MILPAGELHVIDLGLIPYKEAWDLQTQIHQSLVANKKASYPDKKVHYLLLCEHPPVYTLGKSGSVDNLKLNESELSSHQIEYYKINRGGDITFHGPGQLVGYPILDLDLIFTDVHRYVRSLEEVILNVLSEFNVLGERNACNTGVWVRDIEAYDKVKKVCAIGVHLSRWVTMHGFAFNVNTDLTYFNHIIPCGISDPDKSICSLEGLIGNPVDLQVVKELVTLEFSRVFGLRTKPSDFHLYNEPYLNPSS